MIKANVIVKNNSWFKYIKNPEKFLLAKLKKIQNDTFFSKRKDYFFSLLLSSSKDIKILNKKFRKKNKATDILSFPFQKKKELKKKLINSSEIYLGDIIINFKKMNTVSKKDFEKHFNILWVHGLIHLFGYDHKKDFNYKKMKLIEIKLLKKII